MKKILLTTVCRPLGIKFGDSKSVGYELLHGQVTRSQGMFSPRALIHHFSLEYIAHNLETPAVVLQYPSKQEFIREIRKGYEFVGISFVLSTFRHMREMSALVREHAPQSKIILGGYGTVMSDEELLPCGDLICREEGVGFLRRVLGEPVKPLPYDHPIITNGLKIFSLPLGKNGMVFGGLGCPNGCDFCCTSHFFKRKHIRLLPEGDDIFHVIQKYTKRDPSMKFTVLDEDFLLNQKRARRFLELVRASGGPPPSMFVFSSIKALSQYDVRELVEMGVTGLWIGYEGKRSGYAKQQGRDTAELFRELREFGIQILASLVIGFDYQTPEIIRGEFDELLDLNPTFSQVLIYGPTPGTPFYDRIKGEERFVPELAGDRELYYKKCTGFYGMVQHPSLSSRELESLQEECFQRDFRILGPSIIRGVENWLLGYEKLVGEKSRLLRMRAESYKRDIVAALPAFLSAKVFAPSRQAAEYAENLRQRILETVGGDTLLNRVKSWAALGMAAWTGLCLKMDWFQHPKLVRLRYRF